MLHRIYIVTLGLSFVISSVSMVVPVKSKRPSPPRPQPPPRPDNAVERLLIRAMAMKLASITPHDAPPPPSSPTYEEMARSTMQLLNPVLAPDPLVLSARIARLLDEATPPFLRFLFQNFGASRVGCEANALVAPFFSTWLVGPARRVEGEVNGEAWQSTMLIEECRYLKAVDGCRHACVYLCKVPTQTFFESSLGVPVTLTPDFTDNSCRMCFGQAPPARLADDPVMQAGEGVPSLATTSCCGVAVEEKGSRSKDGRPLRTGGGGVYDQLASRQENV